MEPNKDMPDQNSDQPLTPQSGTVIDPRPPQAGQSEQEQAGGKPTRRPRFSLRKKALFVVILVFVACAVVMAVPFTRYKVLGLFISKNVTIKVIDSQTNQPVSSATVYVSGTRKETNGNGVAKFQQIPAGPQNVRLIKKYYKAYQGELQIPAFDGDISKELPFEATGRPVQISVQNKFNGDPLENVTIRVLDTEAKTDSKGNAMIVVPPNNEEEEATFQKEDYNGLVGKLAVINPLDGQNEFKMIPSGKIYFLSKRSGTIDVVKTNLDGSDRKVVLAGTGSEQDFDTSLLATADWRFLALKARRTTEGSRIYLIDTQKPSDYKAIDKSEGEFTPIGWQGYNFVYMVQKDIPLWKGGRQTLKAYKTTQNSSSVIDKTSAGGTDDFFNYYEQIGSKVIAVDDGVVYHKLWTGTESALTGKKSQIKFADFSNGKTKSLRKFPAENVTSIGAAVPQPDKIYYGLSDRSGAESYYQYAGGKFRASGINGSTFHEAYPSYLISPDVSQAFWSEQRDGENTLFYGGSELLDATKIGVFEDFKPYGWFTNNYLIASRADSELYVLAPKEQAEAFKVSNYHSSEFSTVGQNYTYGGL